MVSIMKKIPMKRERRKSKRAFRPYVQSKKETTDFWVEYHDKRGKKYFQNLKECRSFAARNGFGMYFINGQWKTTFKYFKG